MNKKYRLLNEDNPNDLSRNVSELLNEGWALYGNPFGMATNKGGYQHYQALLKEQQNDVDTHIPTK